MGRTGRLANLYIAAIRGTGTLPSPISFALALHTGNPGGGDTSLYEVAAAEYARKAIVFDSALIVQSSVLFQDPLTDWGTISHFSIQAEETAGVWFPWWYGQITDPNSGLPVTQAVNNIIGLPVYFPRQKIFVSLS